MIEPDVMGGSLQTHFDCASVSSLYRKRTDGCPSTVGILAPEFQGLFIQIHTSVLRTLRSLRIRGMSPSVDHLVERSAGFGGR